MGIALTVFVACTDRETTSPVLSPLSQISDAVHSGGNAHFFFLPPLGPALTGSGTFDASLSPVVQICVLGTSGCLMPLVAEFTMTSEPGSETVRVNPADQNYIVNWRTDQFSLDPAKIYRIQVLVAGTMLGFADVDVVGTAKEAKNVQTGQFVPLVNGTTLPIKFRIEVGAVFVVGQTGGSITAQGGNVTLTVSDGALTQPIGITVAPSTGYPSDPGLVLGAEYDFGPTGTKFARPVRLQIAYNPSSIPSGVDENELRLHKVVGGQWVEVFGSEVELGLHAVGGDITSFSQYGVVKGKKVGSVEVSPASATVVAGCTVQLTATVYDPSGNPISRPVNWSTSSNSVARVDQTGLVTGAPRAS